MIRLNLPLYTFKYKKNDDVTYIYDMLRNKYIVLTPEEWVRQNFVSFLIAEKNFPKGLMGNEISLIQNGIKRRCDTLVGNNEGNPFVIVEYKAPSIEITQNVFNQIVRYNSVFKAKYLIVSNGMSHYCCRVDYNNNKIEFLKEIPDYSEL